MKYGSEEQGESAATKASEGGRNEVDNDRSSVQGDSRAIPDKGTSRGMPTSGMGHTEGADLGADATNRMGGFNADSDDADQCHPSKAKKGNA